MILMKRFLSTLYPKKIVASTEQVTLFNLKPLPGSHIKRQRVGRGGKRGGSSGRGNGGQKHHGKRPQPWFTGLYTNPIINALPRWSFAARDLKPRYRTLNLDKLQHWIDIGRIDSSQTITMRTLKESGIIAGRIKDGVKLLANGSEYFKCSSIRIEISKASRAAIAAVEKNGGIVRTVYHSRKGLDVLLRPHLYPVKPAFERPILEKDIEYYTNPDFRGYLSSKDFYEQEFKPRGYIADGRTEAEFNPDGVEAVKMYQVENINEILIDLKKKREYRQELYEQELERKKEIKSRQEEQWKQQKWFPSQGNWKWVEITEENTVKNSIQKTSASAE